MPPPRPQRELQKLAGWLAAILRFISLLAERYCHSSKQSRELKCRITKDVDRRMPTGFRLTHAIYVRSSRTHKSRLGKTGILTSVSRVNGHRHDLIHKTRVQSPAVACILCEPYSKNFQAPNQCRDHLSEY